MSNITVMCGEIQTDGGFEFELPSDLLSQTLNPDCEQSWYLQDGSLIVDPSDPQRLIDPVISVSSDRLVTSRCVNLNYQIICDSADGQIKSIYRHQCFRHCIMDIVNITCAEIQTAVGFVYVILPVIMNHTNNPDCEQSWCLEDGRLIADPSDPQRLIDPVISVSSDRVVTSLCVNLNYQIICDSADELLQAMFRAGNPFVLCLRNETAATPNSVTPDLQHSDQLWWVLAVFIIVLLVLMCFLLRKRIFRCFLKREGSENRDPESDEGQI
ncbi:hypothetical protein Q8A67_001497 [Cirrhinus molitorella]|uniref:Uncharacterized protein n=1 Tax=Cirrhinus molitorella TaxID=172907 RepID=A0AA88TYT9_9TELE|nr:hypothetical protein Q8A67_001497 [Cirrhinus molitorella]